MRYLSYDHHNEPIETSIVELKDGKWTVIDTRYDYSKTKYRNRTGFY